MNRALWIHERRGRWIFWDGTIVQLRYGPMPYWAIEWPRRIYEKCGELRWEDAVALVEAGTPRRPLFRPFGWFRPSVQVDLTEHEARQSIHEHRDKLRRHTAANYHRRQP